jgi:hypothetical protein
MQAFHPHEAALMAPLHFLLILCEFSLLEDPRNRNKKTNGSENGVALAQEKS